MVNMDRHEIDVLIEFDPEWAARVREQWLRLMEIAVWGDLKGRIPGSTGKVRRRVLDLGEKWRSVSNDRTWIPQVRERAKNFLGSALSLRDSILSLERAAKDLDGGCDHLEFVRIMADLSWVAAGPLLERENRLAEALERLNRDNGGAD